MSKRNPNDKSTYTFARLGLGKLGHGKITFDCDSMTNCPHCNKEYNFGREKVIQLEPRYKNNKNGDPDYFWMEWEINTPSVDEDVPLDNFVSGPSCFTDMANIGIFGN